MKNSMLFMMSILFGLSSFAQSQIQDSDGDTKVQTEKFSDNDEIHFEIEGYDQWIMKENRLESTNSGSSLFIGRHAGMSSFSIPLFNVFLGDESGRANQNGKWNSAVGYGSLQNNLKGSNNTAVGHKAAHQNTDGVNNSAFGSYSLENNIYGGNNTAVGYRSLNKTKAGNENTAVGAESMYSNMGGERNTAIGFATLNSNSTGEGNSAVGHSALLRNTKGKFNAAIGECSMQFNTMGSGNSALGKYSLNKNSKGSYNVAIGLNAMETSTISDKLTAVGTSSLRHNTTGERNTAVGYESLTSNLDGSDNTSIGYLALSRNESGFRNTSTGYAALGGNKSGQNNTAIGARSLEDNEIGSNNTAVGSEALENTENSNNTAVGYQSMETNFQGFENTALGFQALQENTNGNFNCAIGANALGSNVTGASNIAIGHHASLWMEDLNNTISIGNIWEVYDSNMSRIGDESMTSIGGHVNWTNISDQRFKKNVEEDVSGLEFITKLRPVTYQMDLRSIEKFHQERSGVKDTINWDSRYDKEQTRYTGFLAQEVEEAAKSVDYSFSGVDAPKNDKGFYGLRYAEFVVPLVKAVQELSVKVEETEDSQSAQTESDEQDEVVADLLERVDGLTKLVDQLTSQQESMDNDLQQCCLAHYDGGESFNSFSDPFTTMEASLEQNAPNPFSEGTEIKFYIPSDILIAQLIITDMAGNHITHYDISETGFGSVRIAGDQLSKGTYIYTLFTDGERVASKQMILL